MTTSSELPDLINSVPDLLPLGGPADRLRMARILADGLRNRADQLVDHYVAEARSAGVSWQVIGESGGVTKQAAQKHFSLRLKRRRPTKPLEMFQQMTPRARDAITYGSFLAHQADARGIHSTHVLQALLAQPDSLIRQYIESEHLDVRQLDAALAACPPEELTEEPTSDHIPFSIPLLDALDATAAVARELGRSFAGPEHVLLAVADRDTAAASALASVGITPETFRRWLLSTGQSGQA